MTEPTSEPSVALQPGDLFVRTDDTKKRQGDRTVYRCDKIVGNIVRCFEQEGPKGRRTDRMFRSVLVNTVDRVLKGSEV